jgi:light-regulated signal transduction histidine kinase (bacteriophytochrome)/ActR/RegA family two-component response regulator
MDFDFTPCEQEPICHLGLIQPHGHLLALSPQAQIIHASEGIERHFSFPAPSALGLSLKQALGQKADRLEQALNQLKSGHRHEEFWAGEAEPYCLWAHQRGDKYILEWEQLSSLEDDWKTLEKLVSTGISSIWGALQIHRQVNAAAEVVRRVTGYDRVMIYQFHPDYSGEVIAEVRHSRAEPFLGLRYPASDIPPQARKLYMENLLRVLVDVYGTPRNLLTLPGEPVLDLTMSHLRAMSPYHVEYLKNLKVGATATASLMVDGSLWGLIACHHERRKGLSPAQQKAISGIAQALSQSIESAQARERSLTAKRIAARKSILRATIPQPEAAISSILLGPERLRNLVRGCGTAVWSETGVLRMGDTPSAQELDVYAARLLQGNQNLVAADSRSALVERFGQAPENESLAGLICVVASREPGLIFFVCRREASAEITWGGDVHQPVLRDEQTGALSPRRSFAQYKQTVTGKAAPWTEQDLATAEAVLEVLRVAAPTPHAVTRMITSGFARMRELVVDDCPLHHSLLDAIGDGISLLFRSDAGVATVRYANQTLLDMTETPYETGASLPKANHLLQEIGLPLDLLSKRDIGSQAVSIATGIEGLRHFLVEKKLALEITDRIGRVSLTALLFNDTTRAERARAALQSAQDRAEHLASMKSSFLANMSHEIRTPMNGILGMMQLLQTSCADPDQKRYLDIMQRSGDLMVNVINDILDFSKIESGRVDIEHRPFDLTSLVEGVLDLMRPRAQQKSLELLAEFDFPPPRWYEGDSFRLRQVILNIVGNGIKFTSVGRVLVRVSRETEGSQKGNVLMRISDTGIGIPAAQLQHVFDKFHQADHSTTRKHGGTGLGLAISRELIGLMGGNISLASTPGLGSTFTVSIPLQACLEPDKAVPEKAPSAKQESKPAGPGAGRRILVTEDDVTNQVVIEAMLRMQGFEVQVADSGLRALDRMLAGPYDLILMDCQMPGMDGYQTTARIRVLEGTERHTPIIALTANALPEDRNRCLDAGMDDYLAKPIQMQKLWEALQKWNCLPAGAIVSQPLRRS